MREIFFKNSLKLLYIKDIFTGIKFHIVSSKNISLKSFNVNNSLKFQFDSYFEIFLMRYKEIKISNKLFFFILFNLKKCEFIFTFKI